MAIGRERMDLLQARGDAALHSMEDGMYLHSACHPMTPTWAVYNDGEVRIECAECEREVITFKVAKEEVRHDRLSSRR